MKCQISFLKSEIKSFEVEEGSNLMHSLLENELPVASSCHGEGVCGKCRVQIVEGRDNLSKVNAVEQFLMEQNNLKSDERISCQTYIQGPVKLNTGYW